MLRVIRNFVLPVMLIACASASFAGGFSGRVINSTGPAMAIGVASCLFSSSNNGILTATRAGDAVVTSVSIARFVKETTGSSFPSGHTAAAFAMASSLAEVHPKNKWLYYAGAALVGWSVTRPGGGHNWADAAAGAALGITVGKYTISNHDGLLVGVNIKF